MHEGEAFYVFNHWDYGMCLIFVLILVVMIWNNKLPAVSSVRDFVNIWNSRGGNILMLIYLTVYALRVSMRLIYHFVDLISEGKLDEKSAIMMVAVSFVTGSVFGLFSGALIKTMTGTEGGMPVPPVGPNGSQTSTQSVVSTLNPPQPPKI